MGNIITLSKFCTYCSTTLIKRGENLLVCKNNHHIYINPKTTNGVIIENEKKEILLVKRKADPGKGLWDVPGGFVDPHETVEESVRREIKEELGFDLSEFRYIGSKYDFYNYQGIEYPTLGLLFHAMISSQNKLIISSDITGYEFFEKNKLPIDQLAFQSLKDFFKEYFRFD